MKPISSITTGPRQSNFELLRIIAMLLVLAVHANFYSLDAVSKNDFLSDPVPSFTRSFLQAIAIVCVNVFVLISGYFRIRPSLKGFCNLCFQCLFASFVVFVIMKIGKTPVSFKDYASFLYLLPNVAWFIKSYIALYLVTPILNIYLDNSSQRTQRLVLIAFFVFQTVYGWTNAAPFYEFGYSAFSFIGLYLLAQYFRKYRTVKNKSRCVYVYISCMIGITLLYFGCTMIGGGVDAYAYIDPLVIIGALSLVLLFSKIQIKSSKAINWIAQSCFMVYLLHQRLIWDGHQVYKVVADWIYSSFDGVPCLACFLIFIIAVFMICVIIDIPRRFIWKKWIGPLIGRL